MKTIIFDFGRTLYDREVDRIFPEAFEVLEKLAAQYKMAIVSLDKRGDNRKRLEVLKTNKIDHYFNPIVIVQRDKDSAYENVLRELKLSPEEIIVVDDRMQRGIKWGNTKKRPLYGLKMVNSKMNYQIKVPESQIIPLQIFPSS